MKIFMICLVAAILSVALADVKNIKEAKVDKKEATASDRSSDSKPKRDASHLSGYYHGPSYKYLPPSSISSSYDSYAAGNTAGYSGGYNTGIGGGYSTGGGIGHGHGHGHYHGHSIPSTSHHGSGGSFHSLGYAPTKNYHGSGHHDLGYTSSSSHYAGHGSNLNSGSFKGGIGSHRGHTTIGQGDYSVGRPHSYAGSHGFSSSGTGSFGVGYNTHHQTLGGAVSPVGSGGGYYYTKGVSGSLPAAASSGSSHGFSSSHDSSSFDDTHHGEHVHNGAQQEHVYVVSNSASQGLGHHQEVPSGSYIPPVQQHPLPSSSYNVPITNLGNSYDKHHSTPLVATEHGPAYAAGHKGLGHFSYTSNKPQVLHTNVFQPGYKQPSYSKAPFKPSTFLGAKFEGSAQNDATNQQYLPPSGAGGEVSGYDYPIPSGASINYHEPNYQQSEEATVSVQEPEATYLTPQQNEIPSAPGGSYLPPSSSYGIPYSR